MTALAWIISALSFMGGLAIQSDMHGVTADLLAKGLFAGAVLSCPLIWESWLARQLLSGKERVMGCVALVLSLPIILLH
ncbi:MAG: hypothetical protein ABI395_00875 [Sphingobium sp.]